MPNVPSPFEETEPPREESKGEAQQRLASLVVMGLGLVDVDFHEFEREALAVVLGALIRRWPQLKDVADMTPDQGV